jgi:B12-binding domain/radical SAM domain protein
MSGDIVHTYHRIAKLRSVFRDRRIVYIAGGPHSTGEPIGTLKLGFDIAVLGEGEKIFPELVYRIANSLSYTDLDGIAFKDGNEYKINPNKERIDLTFPPFSVKHRLFSPIEISRGCPWSCKFCQTPRIFGFEMRHRTCENIIRYAREAARQGYSNMWFISPNAFAYGSPNGKTVRLDRIKQLLSEMKNIKGMEKIFFGAFPSEVRPESVSPEILTIVKDYTSNKTLTIGGQSGSERILNSIGRGHTVEDISNAADLTLSNGLIPHLDFLFGLPDETPEDLEKTKEVISEFVKKGAKIHAHTFIPLPGTPYSNNEPRMLDRETKRWLSMLAGRGKVDGYWIQHEKIASDLQLIRRSLHY